MAINATLQGKTAIVTGASSGIGAAIARRLGVSGAFVHLVGRTPAPMEQTKAAIEAAGGKAEVAVLDVRDTGALIAFIDRAAEDGGRLDVMINNAGLFFPGAILDGDVARWHEMIDVNVVALLVGAQAAVHAMRRHDVGGHIINISSTDALVRGNGVYGATKAAVSYLTEALRRELEDDLIRVSAITPGPVATNVIRHSPPVLAGIAAAGGLDPSELRSGEHLPAEVLDGVHAAMESLVARPDEIAEAVMYIISQPLRLNIADVVIRPAKTLVL